jgi:uncharacterized protein YjiS (DUF1127 family)
MWLACPGSLVANLMARDSAGIDAALGTVAHSVAEEWLRDGEEPTHMVGKTVQVQEPDEAFDITIDREMLGYVGEYVAWCREAPGEHHAEQRVNFGSLMPIPNQGGTADHLAFHDGRLTLTDLKYGVGVQVFAEDNPQVQLYALGAIYEWDWYYDFEEVVIRICQPRLNHFDSWTTTKTDLLAFAEKVREGAKAAWRVDAPRVPGPKQCRFCNARRDCPALDKLTNDLVDDAFEDLGLLRSDTERLAGLLRWRGLFELRFREIFEELERRAGDGESVPGFKLATGRSRRAWKDPEATEMFLSNVLGEDLYTRDLISPNQAEKALRAHGLKRKEVERELAGLIERKPGRQTLVPEGDVRPGEENITDATFGDLDEM